MGLPGSRAMSVVALLIAGAAGAWAQASAAGLTAAQIVERMGVRDQERTRDLKHYRSTRRYEVTYRGFPENLEASMVVEASFDAGTGKSFRIVSQSGSKFLDEKVLKRAIDSEKESSLKKSLTALTPANYRFNLVGSETLASGAAYVLQVEPVQASKFLYRGRIWVDAADFEVVKIDTQPAKNPSFWISKALIETLYIKAGGFWFPEKLRSETRVRLGGTAVLTIDYGSYQVEAATPPGAGGR